MSSEAVDQEIVTAPEGQPGPADGSPPAPDPKPSDDQSDRLKEMRQGLTQKGEELSAAQKRLGAYDDVFETLKQHPDWTLGDVVAHANGESPATSKQGEQITAIIDKFDEPIRGPLTELMSLVRDQTRGEVMAEISPQLAQARTSRKETDFDRGIRTAGVDPLDKDFRAFSKEMESDRTLQILQRADPKQAGDYLAGAFSASRNGAQKRTNGAERVTAAKAASLESGGSRGSQATDTADVFILKPNMDIEDIAAAKKAGKRIVVERPHYSV